MRNILSDEQGERWMHVDQKAAARLRRRMLSYVNLYCNTLCNSKCQTCFFWKMRPLEYLDAAHTNTGDAANCTYPAIAYAR